MMLLLLLVAAAGRVDATPMRDLDFAGYVCGAIGLAGVAKTDDDDTPLTPPPPALPVLITRGPYDVSFVRANGNKPFISSHFPAGTDGKSAFKFNLVPAYLKLPSGQDALIVRSVNGSTWAGNGTTSTTRNPDKLTLTTFITKDGASGAAHHTHDEPAAKSAFNP